MNRFSSAVFSRLSAHWRPEAPELLDALCREAVALGASDIHGDPSADGFRVRYRIDGQLHQAGMIATGPASSLVARCKVVAGIDITERRLPQDGQLAFTYRDDRGGERIVDMRIATFPTVYGEKVTLRLLDGARGRITLAQTGLSSDHQKRFLYHVARQQGLVLATGPTGSGKTTTLYAVLLSSAAASRHVVTLEDPVEYALEGIVQAQIAPKIGFTFSSGLRAVLRHDPDMIMVGEIRDRETADAAMAAALTGHLVISTTHTATAVGALARLLDMGVEPYVLAAALSCILAQRLVRKLCEQCRVKRRPSRDEQAFLHSAGLKSIEHVWEARGCDRCFFTGYRGRVCLFELLEISDQIRHLILTRASAAEIIQMAERDGFTLFFIDAYDKVKSGDLGFSDFLTLF